MAIQTLPDEILVEIFSQLPVKSLLRFRCVSRSWRALISDARNVKYKLPPAMSGLFYAHERSNKISYTSIQHRTYSAASYIDPTLSFLLRHDRFLIRDCRGGLLLVEGWDMHTEIERSVFLYVCNPATRQRAWIPNPPVDTVMELALVFDPRLSPHYRVVCFYINEHYEENFIGDPENAKTLQIFSSDTGEWVESPEHAVLSNISYGFINIVSVNTTLYLSDCLYDHFYRFDLDRDVSERSELPSGDRGGSGSSHRLGLSVGLLHYAMIVGDEMLVWVLPDRCTNEWILKHRASVRAVLSRVAAVTGGGGFRHVELQVADFHLDIDDVVFLSLPKMLFSYHLRSSAVEIFEGGCGRFAYSPCYLEILD